jgi:hypothetical protein
LNTPEKLENRDPAIFSLLTDPHYGFPTQLPTGQYRGFNLEVLNLQQ